MYLIKTRARRAGPETLGLDGLFDGLGPVLAKAAEIPVCQQADLDQAEGVE